MVYKYLSKIKWEKVVLESERYIGAKGKENMGKYDNYIGGCIGVYGGKKKRHCHYGCIQEEFYVIQRKKSNKIS